MDRLRMMATNASCGRSGYSGSVAAAQDTSPSILVGTITENLRALLSEDVDI
jgi:hypothetical protein